jgi:hypothetical protein
MYRYRIWCRDCRGIDFQGCFDGEYKESEESYETRELAVRFAKEVISHCGQWEYEVFEDEEETRARKEEL